MNKKDYIINYLDEVSQICKEIDQTEIEKFIDIIEDIRCGDSRLFVIGVGGSAANASHAVNDFRKILNIETYSASENVSELTARINDEGWETCYSKWLSGSKIKEGDVLLVFSVGGGSKTTSLNLVRAAELGKQVGAKIISVVGRDGGCVKTLSDACVLIPTIACDRITAHAEEWQGIVLHMVVNSFIL